MSCNYSNFQEQILHIPDVPGVSLVAYYGKKPLLLQQLILGLQTLIRTKFNHNFIPYQLEQVHGTIIGCEGIKTEWGIVNKWFYRLRNEIKYIDYVGLLSYLQNSNLFPLEICFAGYQSEFDYQFLSRQQHPYQRSFQIQKAGENIYFPVMMGWSLKNQIITLDLDNIRRDLQQFNCLHKYHSSPQDMDNDLYFRLGTITGKFSSDLIIKIQQEITDFLQNHPPVKIILRQNNLAIVQYQDLSLPIPTTKIYPIADLQKKMSLIQQLYTVIIP